MSFRQGKSSSEKRCKCTHKICNEQIFFNIFFAKIMREKNRGKSVRMVRIVRRVGAVRMVGAVGMMGAVGGMGAVGAVEMVMIVVINRIINFGKGCSLISY